MFGDDFMLALCMWREARGDGEAGMQAVGSTIRNRVKIGGDATSYYREIVRPLQFSSITALGDPELNLWPYLHSPVEAESWATAQKIAAGIISGSLSDNTNGATHYFATSIPMPSWAKVMQMTCQIGNQRFYK